MTCSPYRFRRPGGIQGAVPNGNCIYALSIITFHAIRCSARVWRRRPALALTAAGHGVAGGSPDLS
ncbi:hypothetical protein Taro_037731 [Colocasia esculenta]|uniref:Uncharacterized protein n=1 Tax=Colocasia esculenta TaxID=4460 RepID=A0A843WAN2_COLES|nr:hypothetical protein [Colocasia esculenta]